MKKCFLTLILTSLFFTGTSQNASVEKSTYGVQTGFLGLWIYSESKLSSAIALRSEIGLDAGVIINGITDEVKVGFLPVITLEPRWYYNLNKRENKSLRIDGNSGNFFSLNIKYHPDLFYISNIDNIDIISDLSIVPSWGIRRNIGKHFNYETGIGIGYIHYFDNAKSMYNDLVDIAINLHLRIGYRF